MEKEYQKIREVEPFFEAYAQDAPRRTAMNREAGPEKWTRAWKRFNELRFARLCHYLRARTPDANIGYSILIYRLSVAEINAATAGSMSEWQALIERTVNRDQGR